MDAAFAAGEEVHLGPLSALEKDLPVKCKATLPSAPTGPENPIVEEPRSLVTPPPQYFRKQEDVLSIAESGWARKEEAGERGYFWGEVGSAGVRRPDGLVRWFGQGLHLLIPTWSGPEAGRNSRREILHFRSSCQD